LKIVVVGPVYPYRGGIAHYTTMLAQALSAEHTVKVISFSRQYPHWLYPGDSDRDPSHMAIRTEAEYLIDTLAPWTWWRTVQRIRGLKPGVVLLQWWSTIWAPVLWALAYLLRRRGLAPIFLIHNVLPHEVRPWDVRVTRLVFEQGRAFIVQTERERQRLLALLPDASAEIFAHPTDVLLSQTRLPQAEARRLLGLPPDRPVVLFFGIVRPYKGLRYLVEAVGLLRQRGQCFGLLVAGEFWEPVADYEAQIRQLGLEEQVRLENRYIPNEELNRYFSAADMFVAPYVDMTASLAVKVALGFGLPVITTFSDQALEQAGPRVTQVPPKDAPGLAEAIAASARLTSPAAPADAASKYEGWKPLTGVIERLLEKTKEAGAGAVR
jgi:glycosyltransferase involved in cell wall biosynthesis